MTQYIKMVGNNGGNIFESQQLTVGNTYKVFKVLDDGSGDVWIFDDFGCRNVLYSGEWENVEDSN